MAFALTSPVFTEGQAIPTTYSCDGDDVSPPLEWTDAPSGTAAFALINDDPDAPAGTWVHWVVFDLPGSTRDLPAARPRHGELPGGGRQGTNSWGRLGYGGPCPPSGTHRYVFTLYALDAPLGLDASASKDDVLRAMEGHLLAKAELMGVYTRS